LSRAEFIHTSKDGRSDDRPRPHDFDHWFMPETLHENLSEDEANEIVRRLRQYGIEAEKDQSSVFGKESQWTVAVPDADFKASLEILDALHLPRPRIQSHEAIMKQGSLIPTAKEEERLELYSRQEELREALLKMNGIYDAIVLITGPEKGPFQQKSAEPSSASVMIFCSAEGAIHLKISEIQEFIASAWPNLAKERVTVLLHVEGGKKGDSISPQGGDFAVIGPIEVSKGQNLTLSASFSLVCLHQSSWLHSSLFPSSDTKKDEEKGGAQ